MKTLVLQLLFEIVDQWANGDAFCVQVGANDGVTADPLYRYLSRRNWRGLLLEPNPLYFRRLSELHGKNDRVAVLNVGCSSSKGSLPLYYLAEEFEHLYRRDARGTASLDRSWLEAALSKEGAVYDPSHIRTVDVSMDRLDAILTQYGVTRADVLVIDVEGHELEVLKGFDLASLNPALALVECTNRRRAKEVLPMLGVGGRSVYKIMGDFVSLSQDLRSAVQVDQFLRIFGLGSDKGTLGLET